jgi:uncharacterized membrane protein YidH (DUF202 family)
LSGGPNWPFVVIGIGFALVGVVFMAYGYVRHRDVELALARGEYASLPNRATMLLAGFGVLLGLATVLLLVLHPT